MKILFLGDCVGKKGREVIRDLLSSLKKKYDIDFTIVNGENAAHGKGLTKKIYGEFISLGIDAVTMGNHTYSKRELIEHIPLMNKLIVPNNINDKVGEGYRIFDINGKRLCVTNLLGQALMGDYMSDPFVSFGNILNTTDADIYFVDFHGETTAEKRIFAEYFGKFVQVVVGTHTHIQTADEDILHGDTAFISDVGMCGPYDSIIGRDIDESINRMVNRENTRYTVSETSAILCGVVIEIDDNTNKPIKIERIQIRPTNE